MSSDSNHNGSYFEFIAKPDNLPYDGTRAQTPYGLGIIENCLSCPHRAEHLFCNLPDSSLKALSAITSSSAYPKGATLFVEGQSARGVFVVCKGRVKLSTCSADGNALILRISGPGEVLGLPATITGTFYELTADVLEPTRVNFIHRNDFLAFLKDNGEAALRIAHELGKAYHAAIEEMRTIGLSQSVGERLARLLLEWAADYPEEKGQVRMKLTLTQQEIAQMIGTSRETVSRFLSEFRRKQFLRTSGSTLVITNKLALQSIVKC